MNDEQLWNLINEIQTLKIEIAQIPEGSSEWREAAKRLRKLYDIFYCELKALYRNPPKLLKGIQLAERLKNDYEDLLEDASIETIKKISEFRLPSEKSSTKKWLRGWVNRKIRLQFEVQALIKKFYSQLSLDNPLKDGNDETFKDMLPSPCPDSLTNLNEWLEKWQKLLDYIEQDPEEKLRKCHSNNYPDCNAQEVIKQIISYIEPEIRFTWKAIAETFD